MEWTDSGSHSRSKQYQLLQRGKNPKDLGMNSSSREKNCWRKNYFCVGVFCAYFGQSIEMPCKCGSQVLSRPGEQLSSHTHVQAGPGSSWMLRQRPGTVRNTAGPAPIPTRKHRKGTTWAMQDMWDTAWERVTVGQSNSVASKGASTGLQKCLKHSLHPEKECVWKTAQDRNESVL